MDSDSGSLRIGEFARRGGVSTEVLRAWERRYGLLRPVRSQSGYRLYRPEDLERVARMRQGIDSGLSASEAARFALASPALGLAEEGGAVFDLGVERLISAVTDFDEGALQEILDQSLGAFGLEVFLARLVLPALAEIGDRWEEGQLDVGHEHFASTVIRGRLLGLARLWGQGHGPRALLCCAPGEAHDIGLISFGLLLRSHSWRILYLGTDTPMETATEAARMTEPDLAVVSSRSAELLQLAADPLRELATVTTLALAGPGADEALCAGLGAVWLGHDLTGAVARAGECVPGTSV